AHWYGVGRKRLVPHARCATLESIARTSASASDHLDATGTGNNSSQNRCFTAGARQPALATQPSSSAFSGVFVGFSRRPIMRHIFPALMLLAISATTMPVPASGAPAFYDLGRLGGATSIGWGINASGQVAGY